MQNRNQASALLTGWRLVFTVFILETSYVLNSMDRNLFGVLAPDVRAEYEFSVSEVGLLASVFALGVGIGGLFAAYVVDRFSIRVVMAGSVALFSLTTWAQTIAFGMVDFAAYRILSGIGEGIQVAVLSASMALLFPRHRTLAFGTLSASFGLGALIGPWLGGAILDSTGSWRQPLFWFAMIGIVLVIAVILLVPKSLVPGGTQTNDIRIRESYLNPNVAIMLAAAVVSGFSLFSFVSLFPTYLREGLSFSPADAGFAAGMFGAGALIAIPAGWLGDRINQKALIIGSFGGLMVVGVSAFSLPLSVPIAAILGFFAGALLSGFLFTNVQSLLQRSMPATRTGFASGLFVAFWFLPATISGLVFGVAKEAFGWAGAGIVLFGILPLAVIIAFLFFNMKIVRRDELVEQKH